MIPRIFILLLAVFNTAAASACTNLLVTKGASADGSVYITYTADSAGFYPRLAVFPRQEFPPDAVIDIPEKKDKDGKTVRPAGKIKQVAETYQVLGTTWDEGYLGVFPKQGFINEFQLAIAETTFGGREEIVNPQGLLNYQMLITFALQRAKTAREAIAVMTQLVAEHGYGDEGESISIADKNEAWVFEIVGTGKDNPSKEGAVWVARKVPDGEISVHANQARIGEIPDKPQDDFFYSENIKLFAIEKGFFSPGPSGAVGNKFRFDDAYGAVDAKSKRVCESRTWSIFRRAAPSLNLSPDYHRGVKDAEAYPWSIKPDKKLTTADVFALMRDHFEGTPFDMTRGADAGPYGNPRRWRPLYWKVNPSTAGAEETEYSWERPISTQQTGYVVITQSRSFLPDKVGGVAWYGVDDSYLSCFFPLYCGITEVPPSFARGSIEQFDWNDAWWVFNLVANYANLKYSRMTPDIIKVQKELETKFLFRQKEIVEPTAAALFEANPEAAQQYLTEYSVLQAESVAARWQKLAVHLFTKFNDGYIRGEDGSYPKGGDPYPDEWLHRVITERPEQFKLPKE
ncbi:MAG: C69 family dipeptidase [Planctomycetaceae bacterium]|jgi:dipeptidase|nr:C69 family dipeptidase [Planctomycetaceae bacterium]